MAQAPRKPDPLEGADLVERPAQHPEPRREMREDSPLAAAERRAAEIMEHGGALSAESEDKFFIEQSIIPEGWDYNWKTKTIYNQENPAYQVNLSRTGWTNVPRTRHPEMMPHDSASLIIERDGMQLMERPMSISERVKRRDRQRARDQVRVKEEQLGQAGPGQFERANKDQSMANIKRSYEPIDIPE